MNDDYKVALINIGYRISSRYGLTENEYSTITFDNRNQLIQLLNNVNRDASVTLNTFYNCLIEDFDTKNRNDVEVNQIMNWVMDCDRTNQNLRNATIALLNFVDTNNISLKGLVD